MSAMTVREIVIDWLKAHGSDGLRHCDCECGCHLDDFTPCDEPGFDCVAAVTGPVPEEYKGDTDTWMTPKQFPVEAKGEPDE